MAKKIKRCATGGPISTGILARQYAKGGFLGQEESSIYGDALGQGLGAAANTIVPGAGAAMQLMTGLQKMQMGMIDNMGPSMGNIAQGTDARAAYDSQVDSGAANVLRNLSGIPGIGGLAGNVGAMIDYGQRKKHREIPSTVGYATGGDVQLSSDSMLVQGNPNVTDGNQYGNIALDHNEVVKDNFVFSDKLYDPRTGKSFAKEAETIAKSTGKIERKLSRNPNDILSRNSLRENEILHAKLRDTHESIATSLGMREPDGSTKQNFAFGGPYGNPIDPALTYVRNPDKRASNYIWDQQLNSALNPFYTDLAGNQQNSNLMEMLSSSPQQTPQSYPQPFYPVQSPSVIQPAAQPMGQPAARTPQTSMPKTARPTRSGPTAPDKAEPFSEYNTKYPNAYKGWIPPMVENGIPTEQDLAEMRRYPDDPPMVTEPLDTYDFTMGTTDSAKQAGGDPLRQKFTVGDALQFGEVLSKFRGLGQAPDKEPLYQDRTNVSRNYYRPDQQLLQSSDSYNQAVRSIDTNSANTYNALQANLLSSKFKNDNQILSNVDQMNRGAVLDYEGRLSNKSRFNQAQAQRRDDLNSRNRAAYDQAEQNAYTSMGNLGEALNRKKQGYDTLRTYKDMYPNVQQHIEEYLATPEGMARLKQLFKSSKG